MRLAKVAQHPRCGRAAAGVAIMAGSTLGLFAIAKRIANVGLKITGSVTGPLTITPADNPLAVTSTGTIASTGANNDSVDGAASTVWSTVKQGTISSDGGWGVNLASAGVVDNSGALSGLLGGFETGGFGQVTNRGAIKGTGIQVSNGVLLYSDGVLLDAGRSITNDEAGSITAIGAAVHIEGAFGSVVNDGAISGSVVLDAGGLHDLKKTTTKKPTVHLKLRTHFPIEKAPFKEEEFVFVVRVAHARSDFSILGAID
jgi:hypothetical protein